MDISLVIPLLNEEESLTELTEWIERVMTEHKFSYEVIFIDDGSTDQSLSIIKTLSKNNAAIKGLSFRRNYGKSAALNEGFRLSKGDVVITMDSDLQDSPEEIPELFKMIKTDGYDIISGWKKKRFDPISKTIPTKLYNWATRRLTGIKLHDFNCGLKAYKSEVVKSINVYGEMHRYIPVLAKWQGFSKIGEKVVLHQARKYGETKFGLERFIRGPLDLLSIMFVSKFSKRPMHFFGSLGILSFLAGFIITVWLISEKFYARFVDSYEGRDIIEKPLFFIALLMLMIGVVLFLAGFIGELISKITDSKSTSVIKERININ
ncbi:MAG: glycosyltransferase family 2 protein [Bacteroidetes bacterium]|jgi:glycosyltransferase involved in cell wall biosynthesis|nr:glycosyltransferase family 2 protein [Bacteroidota bacterium]MBT7040072.1 glycosyltransferase family 2 protein [Bacteroidota bacterium]